MKVGTAVILTYMNTILLLNHRKRGWELPGGKHEKGETLRGAANRELAEETGFHVNARAMDFYGYVEHDGWLTMIYIVDWNAVPGSTLNPTMVELEPIHAGFKWVTIMELIQFGYRNQLSLPMEKVLELIIDKQFSFFK